MADELATAALVRKRAELAGRIEHTLGASLALEQRGALVLVDSDATASRTDRIAVRGVPPHGPEQLARVLLAHARDGGDAERPCLRGEEKVLSQATNAILLA